MFGKGIPIKYHKFRGLLSMVGEHRSICIPKIGTSFKINIACMVNLVPTYQIIYKVPEMEVLG
jgi:hypothetical protein